MQYYFNTSHAFKKIDEMQLGEMNHSLILALLANV